ncbi:hypothetical protein PANG_00015 [Paenibacillus phage PG1]|uniref:hypothetical protein n=1 Tax=Paenibacillus phage PG1 TaxID=754053 RepID=UPI0003425968|nr:hypothetical protein PANG_00015 [Paenibacillus phage PG1]AGN33736.1 hypothetical protein PANG_00015 [Paenibacillus phage PG1]
MYPISPLYAALLRQPDREFKVKVNVDGTEYDNSVIADFVIDNSVTSLDGFEVGTAIPSTLTITLRTNYEIQPNAKMIPYLALSTTGLTWEQTDIPWNEMNVPWDGTGTAWLPLGEFYVDKREKINGVWTFTCLDKLVFADVAYISTLNYPTTMKAVWDEICNRLGWTYDLSVQINPSYMVQVGPAGFTMRQVLGYIAGANAASVIVGKDGVIKFKRFTTAEAPVFNMGSSDYIRAVQTNPIKTYSRVVVTYDTEDQLTFEAGSGDENHTLNLENPLMTQAMVNNLQASLNGFAYLPLSMDARGFPQLEHGDIIGFEQDEHTTWLETVTSWEDTNIPWDGIMKYKTTILRQSFSFRGGLKMTIESPSVSEQQSEFVVEGSLTQQVNKIDKTAIKEGKKYYGATITRSEGLVIERDDHLSKAVFNSDELSFYADGNRALWFDLPSRKFKFEGTLEGVDGIFTGDLQAVGGTFSGTLQGVDGTFSGTVQAGRIEGGEIVGSYIEGADILGSSIRTAQNGERIELDPFGFRFYDDFGARRVELGTNPSAGISGHTYYNNSGQSEGLIYATNGELHLIGNNNLRLGTNFGTTFIQGSLFDCVANMVQFSGVVDFSNATVIGL